MAELKKHIFYSLVVLSYNGDTNAIQAWFQEYWDEIGENYDSDEDDDEWIRAFGNSVRYTDAAAGQETISVDGDDFLA